MLVHRRSERFTLPTAIDATAGTLPVSLIDVSRSGFKVHHQEQLPPKGETFTLRFRWNGSFVRVQCTTMWTTVQRIARTTTERPTLASGLKVEAIDTVSQKAFEALLAAFDEKPAAAEPYLFCELVNGAWQQRRTTRRDQPGEGFTVSINEEPSQVERLCSAYANGDGETRKLIRTLAALSIKSQTDDGAARTMTV